MVERVRVEGLHELSKALEQFEERIKGQITTDALKAGGKLIEGTARQRAPVLQVAAKDAKHARRLPGVLRAAITSYAIRWNEVIVRVRNKPYIFDEKNGGRRPRNPNYWWLVEFGTSKMAARPFLRPAFESQKMAAMLVIKAEMERGVALAAAGLYKLRTKVRGRWK